MARHYIVSLQSVEARAKLQRMSHAGSCLCGAVTYQVDGPLRDVTNCHCIRCRRHTGHFMAATAANVTDFTVRDESLRWYDATDTVQYGFCGECGSTLFWRAADKSDAVFIAAGTLDPPTGLATVAALFTADASDYHDLDQTIVQYPKDR